MKSIVCGLILLLAVACAKQEAFSPEENAGRQVATGVSIFESKDSQNQWLLTADAVDFAELKTATLKNPVLLLKQNGTDSARVSGKTGTFDYDTKRVSIQGDARIDSFSDGAVLTTERFFYDVTKDRVWSDVKTVITRGTAKAVARGGIETDSKLVKIELKQQTTHVPKDAREFKK